jgi:hypothetical protein
MRRARAALGGRASYREPTVVDGREPSMERRVRVYGRWIPEP